MILKPLVPFNEGNNTYFLLSLSLSPVDYFLSIEYNRSVRLLNCTLPKISNDSSYTELEEMPKLRNNGKISMEALRFDYYLPYIFSELLEENLTGVGEEIGKGMN